MTLGGGCFLNQGVRIACTRRVVIGEGCLLGDEALIYDSDFHGIDDRSVASAPVILERGVWVGARAIVLKGVTIGAGSVVGAGAVVTRSLPERSLAVGNPARIVRQW